MTEQHNIKVYYTDDETATVFEDVQGALPKDGFFVIGPTKGKKTSIFIPAHKIHHVEMETIDLTTAKDADKMPS